MMDGTLGKFIGGWFAFRQRKGGLREGGKRLVITLMFFFVSSS